MGDGDEIVSMLRGGRGLFCSVFAARQRLAFACSLNLRLGNVMFNTVLGKFSQYTRLRALLLNTGKRKIIEHTANDA
eukprot:COSAG05_NODE_559_length_8689_cov_212.699418_5_plen_77_part_00